LCSTSLAITPTVLGTSRLKELRLHVILTSAAMMDDVFGMVVVQDISILTTQSGQTAGAVQVIRAVLISFAFTVVVPFVYRAVAKPIALKFHLEEV